MTYCKCFEPVSLRSGLDYLKEEITEFIKKPSLDEFSDCSWAVGRLVAGLFGRSYVRMPFDSRHRKKIDARMAEYGCVRSRAHLKDGGCPSLK